MIYLAGIDEAGRGPLAGPVTAAAVVLPKRYSNSAITDSKKLSEKQREVLFDEITEVALAHAVVSVGPRRIDRFNIREATRLAMGYAAGRVYRELRGEIYFLIDGNMTMISALPQEPVVKGDQKILAIAAASILAKVSRDRLMQTLDARWPGYGLDGHKGYPTKSHRERIKELGPSVIHRRSFSGVREFLS